MTRDELIRWVAEVIANNIGWVGPGDANLARWLESEKAVDANLAWAIESKEHPTDLDVSCAVESSLCNLPRPPFGWWL